MNFLEFRQFFGREDTVLIFMPVFRKKCQYARWKEKKRVSNEERSVCERESCFSAKILPTAAHLSAYVEFFFLSSFLYLSKHYVYLISELVQFIDSSYTHAQKKCFVTNNACFERFLLTICSLFLHIREVCAIVGPQGAALLWP
jgi:hypothetical protein